MVKITEIEYHRNGVGGEPFYAVLFTDKPEKDTLRFLASVFPENDVFP